jgi:hypothetical protein
MSSAWIKLQKNSLCCVLLNTYILLHIQGPADEQIIQIKLLVTYVRRLDGQDEIRSNRRDEILS